MRLIDADALKKKILRKLCPRPQDFLIPEEEAIIDCIDDAPTVEQPEIIRCQDCRFGKWDIGDRGMYCGRRYVELGTSEDFFCAAAESREVNE